MKEPTALQAFVGKKEFLVCVDSDGCAMDTMDIKHIRCFGPCMVAEWGLEAWQEPILTRWNEINLYTMTRGINRFKGLVIALTEIDRQYIPIEGLTELADWANHTGEPVSYTHRSTAWRAITTVRARAAPRPLRRWRKTSPSCRIWGPTRYGFCLLYTSRFV